MKHPQKTRHRLSGSLALLTLTPSLILAQETTSQEETIVLSPFTVDASQDRGYIAASSLIGGRLNTPIEDTAGSVSVLTRQFLEDIAANNFQEAVEWSTSATSAYVDAPNPFNDFGVNYRNLAGGYNSRNYFRWYNNSDSFMTERYDLARGPNSIVFGDSGIGGTINISSKRARTDKRFTEVHLRTRDFGGYRIGLDHNQPLADNLGVRFVLLRQDFDDYLDRTKTLVDNALLTAEWRPFEGTTLWGEMEYGDHDRVVANRPIDQYSRWDGSTGIDSPITTGSFPGGVGRHTTDRQVFVGDNDGVGIQNWRNWGSTSGTGVRLAPELWSVLPVHPTRALTIPDYDYTFGAGNAIAGNLYHSYSLFAEQRIGRSLFLEAAFNYYDQLRDVNNAFYAANQQVDVNRKLPDGRPNPYFGQSYVDYNIAPQVQTHDQWEARVNGAYLFDFPFARFRSLVGYTQRDDLFKVKRFKWNVKSSKTGNADIDAPINQLYFRRYDSELDKPFVFPTDADYVERGLSLTNRQAVWRSWQGVLSGRWFSGDRLTTLVGYRRDNVTNDNRAALADPVTKRFIGWAPKVRNLDVNVDNWTLSGLFKVTESLRLYASNADSYDFTSAAVDINGESIPPVISSGWEIGTRLNLFDGRFIASAAYFSSEQTNRRETGSANEINAIWRDLTGRVDVVPSHNDVSAWEGTGWEFEAIVNPTPNLRLTVNVSLPDAKQGDGFENTRSYFEANLPEWQRLLAGTSDAGVISRVNSNLSVVRNRIEGFTRGRVLNNSYDYTANVLGTYSFSSGPLKGFSLGGGANLRGDRLVGNKLGAPYDYLYADAYYQVSAWAGYSTRILGEDVRIQLNVSNLLDEDNFSPIVGGFGNTTVGSTTTFAQRDYTIVNPRSFTLTVTARF
jgi:iron complex outermembrane recepter protein